ncbi:MAG: hypothetical protein CMB58_005115 [Methanobacteriota archaeon]|jgi:hypothetical protein|nr:hypothetical protein [Euryarchaeota archaeon]MBC95057.1 hypothetical protein [Euryarchaeota archaeon]RAH15572.1 MAG: hypothetical protein CMB58_005115 [Euryarchaeota archaeon]|tara:strand:+ start:296 stop:484 length:189 start_codon:yes stop_codon:yes gene_type:complete
MPKIKRPRKGWWRPERYKRIFRVTKVKPSEKGLPPCPACGEWTMQRDGARNELFCGLCGAVL